MSTIKVDTIQTAAGVEVYPAKAHIKYNQYSVTVDGSGNVSSATDVAAGRFTTNFSTAMASANYCATACAIIYGSTEGGNIAFASSSRFAAPYVYSTSGVQTQYRGTYSEVMSDCLIQCVNVTGG